MKETLRQVVFFAGLMLLALGVLLGVGLYSLSSSRGAPAPLARHERPTPRSPIPAACTMNWCQVAHWTTFAPGGAYRAVQTGGSGRYVWVGTWSLTRTPAGWVLRIKERLEGNGDEESYPPLVHVIPLDGNARRGTGDWQDRFSLEAP